MTAISQCHEPGLLIVLARPKSPAYLDEFNEWYNTEHGPLRMRLDFIKNGYRYKTQDQGETTWAGIYDVDRVSALTESLYTSLRKFRSSREQHVMNTKVDIMQRKICRLIGSRGTSTARAPIMVIGSFVVRTEEGEETKQCKKAQFESCSRLPGWRRSRCYEVMDGGAHDAGHVELLCIHEFDQVNSWGNTTHLAEALQPCHNPDLGTVVRQQSRIFHFYHEFGVQDYRQPPNMLVDTYTNVQSGGEKATPMSVHLDDAGKQDLDILHANRFVPPLVH